MKSNTSRRVLFISHGGGPLPLLGDESHSEMVERLRHLAHNLPRPRAILVISAHWEAPLATVTSGARPQLIYDYYGFPPESYRIRYPAPGEPGLANAVASLLQVNGVAARQDEQRGFDHGLFVPLKIMYPEADIPCVQLSLLDGLDASRHLAMGRILAGLDYRDLMIIGSGFSFHNLNAFFGADTEHARAANQQFESWLIETCSDTSIDERQRSQRLLHWQQAPQARFCHPREEHLLPLHVCYGIAQRPCREVIQLQVLKKKASMFLW